MYTTGIGRGRNRNSGNFRGRQRMNFGTSPRERELESKMIGYVNQRLHQMNLGQRFEPPLTPPQFSVQPWNSAVLRRRVSIATTTIRTSLNDIYLALCAQLGLYVVQGATPKPTTLNIPLDIRVQKVSAWLINSDGNAGILTLYPFSFVADNELAVLDATGQKNMYACTGFVWPSNCQNYVLNSTDHTNKVIIAFDSTDNLDIEMHFNILWKSNNSSSISKLYVYQDKCVPELVTYIADKPECSTDSSSAKESRVRIVNKEIKISVNNPKDIEGSTSSSLVLLDPNDVTNSVGDETDEYEYVKIRKKTQP